MKTARESADPLLRRNPRKIPEVVYKQLVTLIATGRFKPGEKLPSERDMAADMGVSRQSIREAINKASTVG